MFTTELILKRSLWKFKFGFYNKLKRRMKYE